MRNATRSLYLTALFFAISTLLPATVEAVQGSTPTKEVQRLLASWDRDSKNIEALLVEGESEEAYRRASALFRRMTKRVLDGPAVSEAVGTATVVRAIAAYRMGLADEALWHWHVAHQLFPDATHLTDSPYEDAREFLESHPPREQGHVPQATPEITKPPRPRGPRTSRTPSQRPTGPISILVESIIGVDGKIREPVILESDGDITLVSATLDSIRLQEFEPAEANGEKVPSRHRFSLTF